MSAHIIVVDKLSDLRVADGKYLVVTAKDYINRPPVLRSRHVRVINLCRDYSYLSQGYYVSLLAEAREDKVTPSVKTILDLSRKATYKHWLAELDEELDKCLKNFTQAPEQVLPHTFKIQVFFGDSVDPRFQELGREVFNIFRCPLTEVDVKLFGGWHVANIAAMSIRDLSPEHLKHFQTALDSYTCSRWRSPKVPDIARYDLAILYNPQEKLPPSSLQTLQKFIRIGKSMGVDVELIERKDYSRLSEFDALFIRETTALDHHTYRFAKKAESEGLVVIDDPNSILKCTNKVYLAELLKGNRIPTPKTLIIDGSMFDTVERELRYPLVLKIPDGSFSRGVFKVNNHQELDNVSDKLFADSDIILAQEYMYTDFDWRVGLLNRQPIFVCKYFMSKEHWQVLKHEEGGHFTEGDFQTLAVADTPPEVIKAAVKAAGLIGDGLYGVDLKQTNKGVYIIEINDNPDINLDVEDVVLKDKLYKQILQDIIRRIEKIDASKLTPQSEDRPLTVSEKISKE